MFLECVVEDTLNVLLENITVTGRDGRVWQLDKAYIRGSMICFYIVPDMLRNAPMYDFFVLPFPPFSLIPDTNVIFDRFKRPGGPNAMRGSGIGKARGRATILRANGAFVVCYSVWCLLTSLPARRGRGQPAPRGIRR